MESTLLIATDEAGYGPKLGPLVIAGTVWRISSIPPVLDEPQRDAVQQAFQFVAEPVTLGSTVIKVDDSKVVFDRVSGLDAMHAIVSASLRWFGRSDSTLNQALAYLIDEDFDELNRSPWLRSDDPITLLSQVEIQPVLDHWRQGTPKLIDLGTRVLGAAMFNRLCDKGFNKADILSMTTLALVRRLIQRHVEPSDRVTVLCDRHGGRQYYAGLLQHTFPEAWIEVIQETRHASVYSLNGADYRCEVHFLVKGDSMTPVAMSSIHAKYLRERFMQSLNGYFAKRHNGTEPLRYTAGYPVDADRFLNEIASIMNREKLEPSRLIRSR